MPTPWEPGSVLSTISGEWMFEFVASETVAIRKENKLGRPALKKGAIERSALELFVEKGVDGTSIRDIAARAGVTEGALYRHHKSKDDLVRALFFENYQGFAKMIAKIQGMNLGFDKMIAKIIEAFFTFYDEDHYVFEFVMLVRHKLLEEVRADEKNPVELVSRMLREAMKKGEIPSQNTDLSTQLLIGMVMQTAIGQHYGRVKGPLINHAGTVTSSCLSVVGCKNGTR